MLGELKYIVPALALLTVIGCKLATTSGTTTPSTNSTTGATTITAAANSFATGPDSTSNYIENSSEALPTDAPGVVVIPNFFTENGVHIGVDEGPVNWVEVTVTGELLDGSSVPAPYRLCDHDGSGTEYWAINEETDTLLQVAAGQTANVTS